MGVCCHEFVASGEGMVSAECVVATARFVAPNG